MICVALLKRTTLTIWTSPSLPRYHLYLADGLTDLSAFVDLGLSSSCYFARPSFHFLAQSLGSS